MNEPVVAAFLNAIFYKNQLELNAKPIKLNQLSGIEYIQKLQHPWPRSFSYNLEFFAGEISPVIVDQEIHSYLGEKSQEFVLNVFSHNLSFLIPGYRDIGYLHAWNNTLMLHKLKAKNRGKDNNEKVEIFPIENSQNVALVNTIEPDYPASTLSLSDTNILSLYATYEGKIGAKAQAVAIDEQYLYIADMFTHPAFRRKGLSSALMHTLHQWGVERGCRYAILVPSRMTRDIELFQRFFYKDEIPFALFIPAAINS